LSDRPTDEPISLAELDARHDELLAQLDELDQRVQSVLKEHVPQKKAGLPLVSVEGESCPTESSAPV
jgi:hypothetical protein